MDAIDNMKLKEVDPHGGVSKLYLKGAVQDDQPETGQKYTPPDIKVGMIIQAYGFPLFPGLKGENLYKVVAIDKDNDKVTFQRTNQAGDIGNMGLGKYTLDLSRVLDAIESVEVGGGTSGLKVWSDSEGLNPETVTEVGSSDVNYKRLEKMYDSGGSFFRKKLGTVVLHDPNAKRSEIFDRIRDFDYSEIKDVMQTLRVWQKEAVNEAGNMLVHNVNPDACEAFLRKYPKVRTVMTSIARRNKDITKGYREFLKFKDKHEKELGGRPDNVKSDTFGSKVFWKYDWMGTQGWAEVYQYIDGVKLEGKMNEMLVSDKTDGRVKQMLNKMKSTYRSLNAINYDTQNKTYLFAFGKKSDADKLEKDFKQARKQNPDKSIGKFEFVRSADYANDNPPVFVKQFKINESVNEARGLKAIQKELDKVLTDIESTLGAYKKAKGTPKEKPLVQKLKDLSQKKKQLEKDLDSTVSGMYKDAELQSESLQKEIIKYLVREQLQILNETYAVYHNSYTSAIDAALNHAHAKGYTYDKEEAARTIGSGPKKPSEGKTNRISIDLYRYGKLEKNKRLHIQVYNMGKDLKKPYELNCYIG